MKDTNWWSVLSRLILGYLNVRGLHFYLPMNNPPILLRLKVTVCFKNKINKYSNKMQQEKTLCLFLEESQINANVIWAFDPWEKHMPASEDLLEKTYPVGENIIGIMTSHF